VIRLELTPGRFLVPVLVRAVRSVGVQARLDVDLLSEASAAAEMIARLWAGRGGADPLRVGLRHADGALVVAFGFPDHETAVSAHGAVTGAATASPRMAAALGPGPDGCELTLSFP
jgi:hypothetical protein